MDVLLIPGLWLDASSWRHVVPSLEAAGYRVHPLSMPGLGVPAAESAHLGIADWVDAVVREIDRGDEPVVLVGHSGGGNVVWGAADARPARVSRVILVDTIAPTDGSGIWEFPIVDGVVPFPGWETFDETEVADLDADTRARRGREVIAIPARIPTDPLPLSNDARHGIPTTMITSTVTAAELRETLAGEPGWAREMNAIDELEIVDLPGGHWPQFAQPEALAGVIVTAIRRQPVAP